MATLMATVGAAIKGASLSQVLAAGGSAISAVGAVQAGNARNAAAQFEAKQLEQQGKAEQAAASIKARNEAEQKRLVMSRARAVGAASGGGQDLGLLGSIEEEGTYRQLAAIWEGDEAAKGRKAQAAASRLEGKSYKTAGWVDGAKTILAGGSSFLQRYG